MLFNMRFLKNSKEVTLPGEMLNVVLVSGSTKLDLEPPIAGQPLSQRSGAFHSKSALQGSIGHVSILNCKNVKRGG